MKNSVKHSSYTFHKLSKDMENTHLLCIITKRWGAAKPPSWIGSSCILPFWNINGGHFLGVSFALHSKMKQEKLMFHTCSKISRQNGARIGTGWGSPTVPFFGEIPANREASSAFRYRLKIQNSSFTLSMTGNDKNKLSSYFQAILSVLKSSWFFLSKN